MKIKHIKALLLLFVIVTHSGCGNNETDVQEKNISESNDTVLVKTITILSESMSRTIEHTASLLPWQEVYMAPATPGKIEHIDVEIGDDVAQGQILVTMNKTNLEQSKINLVNIETELRRAEALIKSGSFAEQQYEQIKKGFELAKSSHDYLLENTSLKAPFNGVVSGKYFENGEIYTGAPSPQTGKPAIISLVKIDKLKALVGISANYYPVVTKGMRAEVVCDIYPKEIFTAEIMRIYPTIDNATKTFMAELKIDNAQTKLRPGMFAKINLNIGKGEAILVSTIALIKQTGTNNVYVFKHVNGLAHKQLVKTGRIIDSKTEIVEGLEPGDEIVIVGQNKLENLMPVKVVE